MVGLAGLGSVALAGAPAVQPFRISLLGGFELHSASGEPISLPGRNGRGILAYLAMSSGRAQARDKLATLLWGARTSDQARASLRQTLSQLRRVINPVHSEALKTDGDAILLDPSAVLVDAVRLQELIHIGTPQALEESSRLFQGDLLEGIGPFSDSFETWLMAERMRLRELMEHGLKMLLEAYQLENATDASIRVALRLLSLDALQEPLHRLLMKLYAEQGRPRSALKQYELCRDLLQKELGVAPEPETQRLADHIRREQPGDATAGSSTRQVESPARNQATPGGVAERRFMTLLACVLEDASSLATSVDAEELAVVTAAFEGCCEQVISQHGGLAYDRLGDTVTAYFGYPQADEHDAERAVRAGLEIVTRVEELTPLSHRKLRARVGIASGDVVISKKAPPKGDTTTTIAGSVLYLATGLAGSAAPSAVVIAEATRQLLGRLFETRDLRAQILAGFGEPVRSWLVLRERSEEGRFDATRGSRGSTRLIGRSEELELLLRRWETAKAGSGQVVILAGEPGIGKSRLVKALREALTDEPYLHFSYFCSPHHQQSPFYPVTQQLKRAAGYSNDDAPEVKLSRLEALLRHTMDATAENITLVANLLSIPTAGRYPPLDLAPQLAKAKTQEFLRAQLAGLVRRQPALMIFDDVHWSDSSTREFLERIVDLANSLAVLIIVTHRPGTVISHTGDSHVTSLVLKHLDHRESEALVETVVGDVTLPRELVAQIVGRADGVPLFLEELAKNALEARLSNSAVGIVPFARYVPHTLSDLLQARLDRLGRAKIVAQEASVIGRRFSYQLLAAISSLREPELTDALAKLFEAELVYARGSPPHSSYSFKHALVQDATYASMLRSHCAALHSSVARALEDDYPEQTELEPEVVARHYAAAGNWGKAVIYGTKAAELAARRWAYHEAVAYIDKTLDMLPKLAESLERSTRELRLRIMLGQACVLASGYTTPRAEAAFIRARELCNELQDHRQLPVVLLGLWRLYMAREDLPRAKVLAARLSELAADEGDRALVIEACGANVVTLFTCGQFREALAQARRAIALDCTREPREHVPTAGHDSRVICRMGASLSLWMLGYPNQAVATMEQGLEAAEQLGHPYTQAIALYSASFLHAFRRDARAAAEFAKRTIELSRKHGFTWTEAYGRILRGWAQSQVSPAADGSRDMCEALAWLEQAGHMHWQPNFLEKVAAAYAAIGQPEEALALIRRALDIATRTGEEDHLAELHRQTGQLLLQRSGPSAEAEAEDCFHRAMEVASSQGARSWELRATIGLASLWRSQGQCQQARQVLQTIYNRFDEGFDTPDLQDALILLESLRAEA